jgi:transposase
LFTWLIDEAENLCPHNASVTAGRDALHIHLRQGADERLRSTLADWVGQTARLMRPLVDAVGAHVMTAKRVHANDTSTESDAATPAI